MAAAANILDATPAATAPAVAPAPAAAGSTPAFEAVLMLQNLLAETVDTATLEAEETIDLIGDSDEDEEEPGDDPEASLAFLSALLTAAPSRSSSGDFAAGGQGSGADTDAGGGAGAEAVTPKAGEDARDFLLKQETRAEKAEPLNLIPVRAEPLEQRAGDASQNLARAVEMLSQSQRPAPAAVVADTVLTHARDPRWADEFNNRISLLVRAGESTASLSMTPLDLGPVEVNVTVRESQATILFSASQAETRALIEASLPRLRELLAAQGFNLSDASVSSGFSRSQQQASAHGGRGGGDGDSKVAEASTRQLGLLDLYV